MDVLLYVVRAEVRGIRAVFFEKGTIIVLLSSKVRVAFSVIAKRKEDGVAVI